MKKGHQLLLCHTIQVNQQIAAANQINLGKGRIFHDILCREDDHIADRLFDDKCIIFFGKKALQAFCGKISADPIGIDPGTCFVDGSVINISGKDYHFGEMVSLIKRFMKQHRQRVGFFPGRAAGHPNPQRQVKRTIGQ